MEDDGSTYGRSRLTMRRLHHSGVRPARVLAIGDAAVLSAPLTAGTLAERAADRMWLETRRGIDLDVLGDLAPVLRAVQGVFRTWRLWRYDVVLVVVGEDAANRPRTFARVGDLLGEVLDDAATATDVVVLGPADATVTRRRHIASPAVRLRQVVEEHASDRVRFRTVPRAVGPLDTARAWAGAMGTEVAASLVRASAPPRREEDEAGRLAALEAVRARALSADPRLEDLVELARTAFGTESAAVTFVDRDRRWHAAVAGREFATSAREGSFCNTTIERADATIVADARRDPRFRSSPLVQGADPVRFYAGYPIESVAGHRIGSFCIYDSQPRDTGSVDVRVLRDLALLAQAEITGADAPPRHSEQVTG